MAARAVVAAASLFALAAGAALAAPEAGQVPVVVEITGDHVEYSRDMRHASARGATVVLIRRRDDPSQWVRILCRAVEVDLRSGRVEAGEGVKLEAPYGTFYGRRVEYDPAKPNLVVEQAAASVALPLPGVEGEEAVGAYLAGPRMGREGTKLFIFRGRVTSCDRANPHWAVEARELVYDSRTGRVKMRGGRVRLLGLSVPVPPLELTVAPTGPRKRRLFTSVWYSKRDGIHSPHFWRFTNPRRPVQVYSAFNIGLKRAISGFATAERHENTFHWWVRASRWEDHWDDFGHYIGLDRAPELGITWHLVPRDSPKWRTDRWDVTLAGGYYREKRAAGPDHSGFRFSAETRRLFHADQRVERDGSWHGLAGRWELYDTGEDFTDLELFAGAARRFTPRFALGAELQQHITSGSTPFELFDVDVRTLLQPFFDWDVTDRWRLRGEAYLDVNKWKWREWEMRLDYQHHCLTFYARYSFLHGGVTFGIDLSGLTGGTRSYGPSAQPPLPPDWEGPVQPSVPLWQP